MKNIRRFLATAAVAGCIALSPVAARATTGPDPTPIRVPSVMDTFVTMILAIIYS